jgi:iron-sulfur cluster insertion protein
MMTNMVLDPKVFDLTENAVNRIAHLMTTEDGDVFRIAVNGGGCSGFQYDFSIDDAITEEDHVMTKKANDGAEVKVAVDAMSLGFLEGSQLDYVQELIGSYFQVSNPNATASCGCGTSFAV